MWFSYGFAVLAGVANALQSGANATLAKSLGQPFAASLVVVLVSFAGLLTAGLVSGQLAWPGMDKFGEAPWWAFVGGLLGACLLLSQLFVAQHLGAGVFLGLTVTAAVVTSLVLDHWGLMGFREHPAGLWRIVGGALMIAGLGLVARF